MSSWQPTASIEALRLRAEVNATIRSFFAERNVLEVETPVLSQAGNSDPNILSFSTAFDGPVAGGERQRWLRTSPEYAMKRLLAAGVGDCYELGRVFRNGEAGRRHNPEFTLLEWYRLGWDEHTLMLEVASLVRKLLVMQGISCHVRKCSYRQLFREALDIDPFAADPYELMAPLSIFGIDDAGLTRDDWLDLLLTHLIQPSFPADQLLLLYDYPASQAALARTRQGDGGKVAARFEVFLGSVELANGYHELGDAAEQRHRFEADRKRRAEAGQELAPLDENLLAALEHGLPECAGVALGLDRLLVAMLDDDHLDAALAFPFERA